MSAPHESAVPAGTEDAAAAAVQAPTSPHAPASVPAAGLAHRSLLDGPWWQERLSAWADVSEDDFRSHRWQLRNTVTRLSQLLELVEGTAPRAFVEDLEAGFEAAPMQVRITPYLLSLIDWQQPWSDPLRRQFIPLGSELEPDHPMCTLDSLEEQRDAAAPGLTHRYPDKVLFLALDVCPVYCRFCTRSYAVGGDTGVVDKVSLGASKARWAEALDYLRSTPQVEDVVVSGGDAWLLSAAKIEHLGEQLLDIPHIRRIRFATKGIAVMPQKVCSDDRWLDALTGVAELGRRRGKQVAIHTHANHPAELTAHTAEAMAELFARGIVVRNQSVLQAGVNDDPAVLRTLIRRLSWLNIQPYYVYTHDMVPGVETLRTSLGTALHAEKEVRGSTAGFNTPTFVCDAYGGGGKRDAHSFELYDRELGVAVYRSPVVDARHGEADRPYFYFDPLRDLDGRVQQAWKNEAARRKILDTVVDRAGFSDWN